MVPEHIEKLIEQLVKKTQLNQATWQSSSGEHAFQIKLKAATIEIDLWIDERENTEYAGIRIYNNDGVLIDYYAARYSDSNNRYSYDLLLNFHSVVKRSYYNVDKVMENLFKEIETKRIVGRREIGESDDLPF